MGWCLRFSSPPSPERQQAEASRFRFSWTNIFRAISSSSSSSAADAKASCASAPPSSSFAEPPPHPHRPPLSSSPEAPPLPSPLHAGDGPSSSSLSDAAPRRLAALQNASDPRTFSYAELRMACQGFSRSNLVGEGGFGCVYRGFVKSAAHPSDAPSLQEVAVKLLNRNGQQGHKEWLAEVRFLGLVDHPNLVKLVGYCAEDDERGIQRLLVYEFVARGSLENYLFLKSQTVLPWQQRLEIMLGAARGLAYLHREIKDIQVIFRDFKTSNILLDEDFTAKLSDFGLARQGPEMGATHVSTSVVGTIGYAAPEYVQTGHLTSKSDVWSFGVVLFEVLTGRRSVDRNRPKSEQHLLEWVRPNIHGSKKIHYIMDPRLKGDYSLVQAQKIVELAVHCCHRAPRARPTMSFVVKKLISILEDASSNDGNVDVALSKETSVRAEQQNKELAHFNKKNAVIEDVRRRFWAPKAISV